MTYTHAYIYLIREREFLLRNEPVYKIGRGEQDADRVIKRVAKGYKKGSEIWLTIRCPILQYKDVETSLKNTFRQRFSTHGDGSEYFQGNPREMIKIITEVVNDSWSTDEVLSLKNQIKANDESIAQVLKEMSILQQQFHMLTESNKVLRNELDTKLCSLSRSQL